jgi:hypothetical protein
VVTPAPQRAGVLPSSRPTGESSRPGSRHHGCPLSLLPSQSNFPISGKSHKESNSWVKVSESFELLHSAGNLLDVVQVDRTDPRRDVQPHAAFNAHGLQRDLLVAAAKKHIRSSANAHGGRCRCPSI